MSTNPKAKLRGPMRFKKSYRWFELISRGGLLDANLFNDGGDSWKVEIRHSGNGALHRKRYFNFQRDGAGVYAKARRWAHEAITITPMTFATGSHRRGGFR